MAGRAISDCRECFSGQLLAYFETLQTLFGTPTDISARKFWPEIEVRQLWGLLWGPLIHLGASRHISIQLATTAELFEPERVAELLPSVQQLS